MQFLFVVFHPCNLYFAKISKVHLSFKNNAEMKKKTIMSRKESRNVNAMVYVQSLCPQNWLQTINKNLPKINSMH